MSRHGGAISNTTHAARSNSATGARRDGELPLLHRSTEIHFGSLQRGVAKDDWSIPEDPCPRTRPVHAARVSGADLCLMPNAARYARATGRRHAHKRDVFAA